MKRIPAIFVFALAAWLFCQPGDVTADERLTLYDRNRRNLKAKSSSSRSRYEGSSDSQRRYYGGRDYYYDDNDGDDDRGRQRTIGRPIQPYE